MVWSSPPLGHPFLRQTWPNRPLKGLALLPDPSTKLDSFYFFGSRGGLWVEIGAVSGRQFRKNGMLRWKSARCFPLPAPNSELETPADV